jgi:hypothetical protein
VSGNGAARYSWPEDTLTCVMAGRGRPRIAVGLLPHANEPLGSAFAATIGRYRGGLGTIGLIGPIDPPPPSHRFPLPCDPVGFVSNGYLSPLAEQVEFAHCPVPVTPAQRRAAAYREQLRTLRADALVMLHNDPAAQGPYLYANSPWPAVERRLADDFPDWKPPGTSWTHRIGTRTFAFFPGERIGVDGTESAGLYIERELGIPTLTLELPMFGWLRAERQRLEFRRTLGEWVAAGGADGGDRPGLIRYTGRLLDGREVTMIPPAVTSRVVWSALAGLRESLTVFP